MSAGADAIGIPVQMREKQWREYPPPGCVQSGQAPRQRPSSVLPARHGAGIETVGARRNERRGDRVSGI